MRRCNIEIHTDKLLILFIVISILCFISQQASSKYFFASSNFLKVDILPNNEVLYTEVGLKNQAGIFSTGKRGYLVYGPYLPMDGKVDIEYKLEIHDVDDGYSDDDTVVYLTIVSENGNLISEKRINKLYSNEDCMFKNVEFNNNTNVEFQVFCEEGVYARFFGYEIKRSNME